RDCGARRLHRAAGRRRRRARATRPRAGRGIVAQQGCVRVTLAYDRAPIAGRYSLQTACSDEAQLMGMKLTGLLTVALAMGAIPAQAQDLAAGERSFLKCKPCHQVGDDAINGVGPVLNGIIGRKAGTYDNYNYSAANKNSGLTWDEATFKEYIKN